MTSKEANDLIVGVHNQAFFGYLEQHGIRPQTEKEAQDLLELAGMIEQAAPTPAVAPSRFGGVKQALAKVLGLPEAPQAPGFSKQSASVGVQLSPALIDGANQAAAELLQDPTMYEAVLLKQAELKQAAA